jgi:hypothetical protein
MWGHVPFQMTPKIWRQAFSCHGKTPPCSYLCVTPMIYSRAAAHIPSICANQNLARRKLGIPFDLLAMRERTASSELETSRKYRNSGM